MAYLYIWVFIVASNIIWYAMIRYEVRWATRYMRFLEKLVIRFVECILPK